MERRVEGRIGRGRRREHLRRGSEGLARDIVVWVVWERELG